MWEKQVSEGLSRFGGSGSFCCLDIKIHLSELSGGTRLGYFGGTNCQRNGVVMWIILRSERIMFPNPSHHESTPMPRGSVPRRKHTCYTRYIQYNQCDGRSSSVLSEAPSSSSGSAPGREIALHIHLARPLRLELLQPRLLLEILHPPLLKVRYLPIGQSKTKQAPPKKE